jgi:hypothetical protein
MNYIKGQTAEDTYQGYSPVYKVSRQKEIRIGSRVVANDVKGSWTVNFSTDYRKTRGTGYTRV